MGGTKGRARIADRYRVRPGIEVQLADHDPSDTAAFRGGKDAAKQHTRHLNDRLEELQALLYAEGKHKLLVILQAPDAGGKDGTIRSVFDGVNPQGVKVASFKKPTEEELAHDYLWRIHAHTPGRGEITIFNRSHYEDVLIVRVRELAPPAVWERRYQHINDFERLLTDEGTTILKIFLHISPEEQRERLQERLDIPRKRWKFRKADLQERSRWDEYTAAFETVLSRTSTPWAPWYVVPANRNWYRNLVVSDVIVHALESLDMRYPDAEPGLSKISIPKL